MDMPSCKVYSDYSALYTCQISVVINVGYIIIVTQLFQYNHK